MSEIIGPDLYLEPGVEPSAELEQWAQRYQAALTADPENPALLHRLGVVLGRLGQGDLELALIGQAIARAPTHAGYHADLGLALLSAGYREDAAEAFEEATRLDPTQPDAKGGQADLHLDQGNPDEARRLIGGSDFAGRRGERVRGRLAALDGRWSEAVRHLLAHLNESPLDAAALFYLGVALQAGNLLGPAALAYRQAVGVDPTLFEGHANLSTVLSALGETAAALDHAERAVALAPDRPGALLNRANALKEIGDTGGALSDLTRALTIAPEYAEVWSTLGNLYHDLGEMAHALDAHDRAVALRPALAQARWNRAFTLLATGQLAAGWEEYEWRRETAAAAPEPRAFRWPVWSGEPLLGKRILVWREQGLGDELLFLTCLPDLLASGASVTLLASPRLVTLVQRSFPTVEVVPDDASSTPPGSFDFQSGLASLPRWLRRGRDSFPARGDWLVPDAGARAKWTSRLAALGPGLRVGLCWRSGLITPERRRHYPPVEALGPLLKTPGIVWINLQYDDCREDLARVEREWGVRVHQWEGEDLREDVESVAGLVAALDRVVTAPTAVSSIAGAVGCDTWQLDSGSDWTAFGEPRSPWFPSIRVVGQHPGDASWDRVVREAAAGLVA